MSMKPFQARLALLSFLAVGTGIAVNILYLQETAPQTAAARQKTDRARQKADSDRTRRLALETKTTSETPPVSPPPAAARKQPSSPIQAAPGLTTAPASQPISERVGRFSPSSGRLDTPAIDTADAEMRLPDLIRSVQKELVERGYEPGTPDGLPGVVTRAAIMAYEHDQGLPVTADATPDLLSHLQRGPAPKNTLAVLPARAHRAHQAEQLTRTVQQSLAMLGYFAAAIDGRNGEDTARAIREYEMDAGLVPTGRISAPLMVRLARSSSTGKAASR